MVNIPGKAEEQGKTRGGGKGQGGHPLTWPNPDNSQAPVEQLPVEYREHVAYIVRDKHSPDTLDSLGSFWEASGL